MIVIKYASADLKDTPPPPNKKGGEVLAKYGFEKVTNKISKLVLYNRML